MSLASTYFLEKGGTHMPIIGAILVLVGVASLFGGIFYGIRMYIKKRVDHGKLGKVLIGCAAVTLIAFKASALFLN